MLHAGFRLHTQHTSKDMLVLVVTQTLTIGPADSTTCCVCMPTAMLRHHSQNQTSSETGVVSLRCCFFCYCAVTAQLQSRQQQLEAELASKQQQAGELVRDFKAVEDQVDKVSSRKRAGVTQTLPDTPTAAFLQCCSAWLRWRSVAVLSACAGKAPYVAWLRAPETLLPSPVVVPFGATLWLPRAGQEQMLALYEHVAT